MSDAVRRASVALREALASLEVSCMDARDCASLADELALTEKACGAARLLACARAAASGLHREKGFSDPGAWFARQGGTSGAQGRRAFETAAHLEECKKTKEALLAGEVSLAQAAEITRAESEAPGQEDALLAAARRSDLAGLRDEVRDRRLERQDPGDLHRRQHRARRLGHWRDGLGMVRLDGALPPEVGIPFVTRIEELAQKLRRARAQASPGATGPERFEAYAADALVSFGEGAHETPRAPRAEIVFVCDLFAYRRGHAHRGEVCHIVGGGPVPVSVVEQFSADAFVKAVLHDGARIHSVAHFGRHIPAELRTALDLGPVPKFTGRTCVDCGRRYGLEYDHLDPVANHGLTSYENLVARCYPDHQAKTERDRKAGLLGMREQREPTSKRRSSPPRASRGARAPASTARAPASTESRAGPGG